MSKKRHVLPEDILKRDPGQQARIRSVLDTMLAGSHDEEPEELSLFTDQAWRAKMDQIEARLTRLEEEVKRQQTAKGE